MTDLKSNIVKWVDQGLAMLLSHTAKGRSERIILVVAIASYLVHLSLIFLANQGYIPSRSGFLTNPIAAIYTPFSFILVFEVYMLIFYLPRSTSFYIGKQYEIITLIIIRRIFKDIGNLELQTDWFNNKNDLQFTYDAITSLLLFGLIYLFYLKVQQRENAGQPKNAVSDRAIRFVFLKKCLSLLLVPVLVVLAFFSFLSWADLALHDQFLGMTALAKVNNVFFDEFFTILIIVDVLLLLTSFFYSDRFHTIIRNSGFVISTILIKLSFSVSGIINNALIVGAVIFGLLILLLHNMYERDEVRKMTAP